MKLEEQAQVVIYNIRNLFKIMDSRKTKKVTNQNGA